MIIFLFLLILPISLSFGWALNISSFWAQSASDQVRIDSVALSLCHGRLGFIRNQILPPNREIRLLQTEMDSITAACLANPYPWACDLARPAVAALSAAAKSIELEQEMSIQAEDFREIQKLRQLLKENNLSPKSFGIQTVPTRSSWGRRVLRADQFLYQSRIGVSWPRQLQAQKNFENLNTVKVQYGGARLFLATRATLETRPSEILSRENRFEFLQSSCSLRVAGGLEWLFDSEMNFKVARLQ